MTDEYRDVPNGYVYLYEREGWEVVERGGTKADLAAVARPGERQADVLRAEIERELERRRKAGS